MVPQCVGTATLVPPYLTLFPDQQIDVALRLGRDGIDDPPLCDRKEVVLTAGANAAADFWLFTEVPVAAHANGFILDDTQNEFDPNSPNFGEKYAPPFVPVTIRDWSGRIINKTLSDQYGTYNFIGALDHHDQPAGAQRHVAQYAHDVHERPGRRSEQPRPQLEPAVQHVLLQLPVHAGSDHLPRHPGGAGGGLHRPRPVPAGLRVPRRHPADLGSRTGDGIGPYVAAATGAETITITSMGTREVQNPDYCNVAAGACPTGADTTNKFVSRDYGFGPVHCHACWG